MSVETWNPVQTAVAALGQIGTGGESFDREYAGGMIAVYRGIADMADIAAERGCSPPGSRHSSASRWRNRPFRPGKEAPWRHEVR